MPIPHNPIAQRVGRGMKTNDADLQRLRKQNQALSERVDDLVSRLERLEVRRGRPPKRDI